MNTLNQDLWKACELYLQTQAVNITLASWNQTSATCYATTSFELPSSSQWKYLFAASPLI